jgi:hypothetical protein
MGIQSGKWLIEKQRRRFDRQRAGKRGALLFAARNLPWVAVLKSRDVGASEKLRDAPGLFLGRKMANPEGDVLAERSVREKSVVLEQHSHAPLARGYLDALLRIEQRTPVQNNFPAIGAVKARDAP